MRDRGKGTLSVPEKASRVLAIILVCMILIVLRLWHLVEVQYEDRVEESVKPRRRVFMEPAKRGTIRDRFNTPLAINRVQYQAGVIYNEIKQIPSIQWTMVDGKRTKIYRRKEYIHDLSELLARELGIDSKRIEDLIYSKATFYFQLPFILKENITEQEYYRLNMLAKDWPGLHVQRTPRRFYPFGKVAGDVIGYMGAINKEEYEHILEELKHLREYHMAILDGDAVDLPEGFNSTEEVLIRLKNLEDQAYSANDLVGKGGIEQQFESTLRGFHGKKVFYSDSRGNFLRELPGTRPPLSGQRVILTLSAELQEYAEQLLAMNEKIRKIRVKRGANIKDPWVKGGAIVVMDPNTGEIITLASYPRFDPNDFVASDRSEVNHWFETDPYIGELWDQKKPLEREIFSLEKGKFEIEQQTLSWDLFLEMILPDDHPIRKILNEIGTVSNAVRLQRYVDRLLELSGQDNLLRLLNILYDDESHHKYGTPSPAHVRAIIMDQLSENETEFKNLKSGLGTWFNRLKHNYDKLLLVDLCRLAINAEQFDDNLLEFVGHLDLSTYRNLNSACIELRHVVRDILKHEFRETYFLPWREQYGKDFLKSKRLEEVARKTWARPFIDYYDKKEQQLFDDFWEKYKNRFLSLFLFGEGAISKVTEYDKTLLHWHNELSSGAHQDLKWNKSYQTLKSALSGLSHKKLNTIFQTFRSYQDLDRPLYGRYKHLRKEGKEQIEKNLAAAFYPIYGFGNARSFAYRQATTQGSLFKLVTAYTAMMQRYRKTDDAHLTPNDLNPLTMIDKNYKNQDKLYVGQFTNGKPIPQMYKGGRMMKSVAMDIGKIDLLGALETSSNPYFSLVAGDVLEDPQDLARTAKLFSYGSRTGVELPMELGGRVPDDLDFNKTGLYAMANGQHTLVVTPLQSSVMLSAIANGGYILQPKIVGLTAGYIPNRGQELKSWQKEYPFKDSLALLGIDFPLFINSVQKQQQIQKWPTQIAGKVEMPMLVRNMLLEGMHRVMKRLTNQGLGGLSQLYTSFPGAVSTLTDLKNEIVGKTSTSESMENLNLDLARGTQMFNHVWFGGIVYDQDVNSQGFLSHDQKGKPELIVVVFLRYGAFGKEAAPIAAQMVKKWREIKARHL